MTTVPMPPRANFQLKKMRVRKEVGFICCLTVPLFQVEQSRRHCTQVKTQIKIACLMLYKDEKSLAL